MSDAEDVIESGNDDQVDEKDEKIAEAGAGQVPDGPAALSVSVEEPVFPALPRKRKLADRQKVC